jgi:hypothetical protein
MVITGKSYDTSTLQGQLECVADMLAMPADNLNLSLRSSMQQVVQLNLSLVAEASKKDTTDERRAELLQKLGSVNRGFQMILEALALLEATKWMAEQLAPKPEPDLPPGPPIVRQTRDEGQA